ncbi:MAG: sensor histidine kinase [Cellvibrionaceae bacterium]
MDDLDAYKVAYQREKLARKQAEQILEDKTHELMQSNIELQQLNETLSRQQAQLVQTEKLAALGTLAAGIAHEINNPMAFVASNIQALKRYCGSYVELCRIVEEHRDKVPEAISEGLTGIGRKRGVEYVLNDTELIFSEVESGMVRVQEIVSNLKSFARTKPGERDHSDTNEAITSALKILTNELRYKCAVSTDLKELPSIYCNLNEVSQVFLNIIHNAAQSIEKEGRIDISSHYIEMQAIIQVIIKDTGKGMDEATMAQIFDPFFTKKPLGQGTGLGLSVSHGIIEALGGSIKVTSQPKKGTTFFVNLPVEQRSRSRNIYTRWDQR